MKPVRHSLSAREKAALAVFETIIARGYLGLTRDTLKRWTIRTQIDIKRLVFVITFQNAAKSRSVLTEVPMQFQPITRGMNVSVKLKGLIEANHLSIANTNDDWTDVYLPDDKDCGPLYRNDFPQRAA